MKNNIYFLIILFPFFLISCQGETKKVVHTITAENDTLVYRYDTTRVVSNAKIINNDSVKMDSTYAYVKFPIFDDDNINKYILNIVQFPESKEKAANYKDFATKFINDYNKFVIDFPSVYQSWYMDMQVIIKRQNFNYICIANNYADYTGGAHGNYYTNYYNFNPKTLKPITLDSLIIPGSKKKLIQIAEAVFREKEKISAKEPLDNKYFFDKGKFSLPDNFYISNNGLSFLYNIYEIKPYSDGITEFTIPKEKLKDILKPNTILSANTSL